MGKEGVVGQAWGGRPGWAAVLGAKAVGRDWGATATAVWESYLLPEFTQIQKGKNTSALQGAV